MTKFNIKKFLNIKIFIIYFILCFETYSSDLMKNKDMIVVGSQEAIIKIKIFSSLTCPHCADFHIKVIPKIKKEYVETGKVQLIFIDFPLDQAGFNASKLLHCVNKNMQIKFLCCRYAAPHYHKWKMGQQY